MPEPGLFTNAAVASAASHQAQISSSSQNSQPSYPTLVTLELKSHSSDNLVSAQLSRLGLHSISLKTDTSLRPVLLDIVRSRHKIIINGQCLKEVLDARFQELTEVGHFSTFIANIQIQDWINEPFASSEQTIDFNSTDDFIKEVNQRYLQHLTETIESFTEDAHGLRRFQEECPDLRKMLQQVIRDKDLADVDELNNLIQFKQTLIDMQALFSEHVDNINMIEKLKIVTGDDNFWSILAREHFSMLLSTLHLQEQCMQLLGQSNHSLMTDFINSLRSKEKMICFHQEVPIPTCLYLNITHNNDETAQVNLQVENEVRDIQGKHINDDELGLNYLGYEVPVNREDRDAKGDHLRRLAPLYTVTARYKAELGDTVTAHIESFALNIKHRKVHKDFPTNLSSEIAVRLWLAKANRAVNKLKLQYPHNALNRLHEYINKKLSSHELLSIDRNQLLIPIFQYIKLYADHNPSSNTVKKFISETVKIYKHYCVDEDTVVEQDPIDILNNILSYNPNSSDSIDSEMPEWRSDKLFVSTSVVLSLLKVDKQGEKVQFSNYIKGHITKFSQTMLSMNLNELQLMEAHIDLVLNIYMQLLSAYAQQKETITPRRKNILDYLLYTLMCERVKLLADNAQSNSEERGMGYSSDGSDLYSSTESEPDAASQSTTEAGSDDDSGAWSADDVSSNSSQYGDDLTGSQPKPPSPR